jgi:hypothetical protein
LFDVRDSSAERRKVGNMEKRKIATKAETSHLTWKEDERRSVVKRKF